jgi:hypothetical protein
MEDRPKKSYNVGAEMVRQGLVPADSELNLDDMELIEALDLSPGLAYRPGINKAAAEAQRQRNIKNGMAEGLGKNKAIKVADKAYNEARKLARNMFK